MDFTSLFYELWVYLVFVFVGLPLLFIIRCMVEFHNFTFRQEYVRKRQLAFFTYD